VSVLRRALEARQAFDPSALTPYRWGAGRGSSSGVTVNDRAALSVIDFFAGVRIISDAVSLTPLQGFTQDPSGLRIPVVNKPVQLIDPFMDFNLQQGLGQIVTSLILRGNAYGIAVGFDRSGTANKWRILNPDQVAVTWDAYGFRQYTVNGELRDTALMWHVASNMLPNDVKGMGIVEYCRNAIGLGIALDEVSGSFFKNGIMSTGIISTDVPLTQDEVKATAEQFIQNHAGVGRSSLPIVIGGGAKYTPISLTPEDSQFLQSREFQRGEIATLLGIPPHLLGIIDRTTSWGTGIEVQGRAFVDYTLRAYFVRLESLFSSFLQPGTYAAFDTDAITRATTQERYHNWNTAILSGFLNVDEVRRREGLPPLPDGDGEKYYTPIQVQTVPDPESSAPAAAVPTNDPATDL